jgi:hypothetical protein
MEKFQVFFYDFDFTKLAYWSSLRTLCVMIIAALLGRSMNDFISNKKLMKVTKQDIISIKFAFIFLSFWLDRVDVDLALLVACFSSPGNVHCQRFSKKKADIFIQSLFYMK